MIVHWHLVTDPFSKPTRHVLFLNFNPHVALGLYTCMYNSCWDRDLLHYIRKKKSEKNVNDQEESLGYYQTSCVYLKGSGLQTPWENLNWIYRHLTPFETPLAFQKKGPYRGVSDASDPAPILANKIIQQTCLLGKNIWNRATPDERTFKFAETVTYKSICNEGHQ